jgi:hypothetical protein
MAVAASREGGIMLRCDPADTDRLLQSKGTRPTVMKGRELDGWLRVDPDGLRTTRQLSRWVGIGVAYAGSLPAKPATQRRRR